MTAWIAGVVEGEQTNEPINLQVGWQHLFGLGGKQTGDAVGLSGESQPPHAGIRSAGQGQKAPFKPLI